MSQRFLTYFIFLVILFLPSLVAATGDDNNRSHSPDNASMLVNSLVDELNDQLSDSNREAAFYLQTNLPDDQHRRVIDRLLDEGFKLQATRENSESVVEVEINPEFMLERISRRDAVRTLGMEYSIHFVSAGDIIEDNLRSTITRTDTVSYQNRDDLVTDWPATRFTDVSDASRWRWVSAAAEPAVLIGATAIAVVLLYNTRSN